MKLAFLIVLLTPAAAAAEEWPYELGRRLDAYVLDRSTASSSRLMAKVVKKQVEDTLARIEGDFVWEVTTTTDQQVFVTGVHTGEPCFVIWSHAKAGKLVQHGVRLE